MDMPFLFSTVSPIIADHLQEQHLPLSLILYAGLFANTGATTVALVILFSFCLNFAGASYFIPMYGFYPKFQNMYTMGNLSR